MNIFTKTNDLNARALIRQKCSCLEEYLLMRDLNLDMSKFSRAFDIIALLEKHPKVFPISKYGELNDKNLRFLEILFMWIATFAIDLFMQSIFPYATHESLTLSFIFIAIGNGCLAVAFYMKVLDAVFALRFAHFI